MKPPFTSHLSFILGFICQYVQVLHVMGFSAQHWSHTAMKDFADRLTQLEQSTVPESLQSFYEPQLKSFSVQPGAERFSITSTCYALQAMLATENPSIYEAFVLDPKIRSMDDKARTPVRDILRELLASDWRTDDLFQVPLLLYTMLKVDVGRDLVGGVDEQTAARIRSLLQSVFLARPRRRDGMRQAYSDYILFQCAQVYAEIYDGTVVAPPDDTWSENDRGGFTNDFDQSSAVAGFPSQAVPDGAPSSIALALNRCAETSYNTLCRQLALRAAGAEFDVMSLTYALLSYVVTTNKLSNTAGREVVPGQGPSGGTKIRPVNRKLVIAGLAAFMEEQGPDGMWEKGEPIYRSFRRKRNIGNAFIFAVDTVSSLLEHLPAEDFRPHLAKLYKLLEWIEFHHAVEILPEFCDPETGQCYGKAIMGWTSPHLNADSGPQAWSTAQTSACISRMKTTIETLMHNDVLDEFRGLRLSQKGQNGASWDRLLDTDLGKCGMERVCTLKEVLEERMIAPRLNNEDILNESYSAVLFGPPGSAKTTIGQSLAEKIGYDFLTIDTSEFLADGLTCVASRIRYVFSRLQALRRCVILFDEIEEFCLDRESPGIGMESRMLTTAMLTAINDLRRAKKSIFFVATNRLRAFDAAIIRPGRFDMQLFVGTPNLKARSIQFNQAVSGLSLDSTTKQQAMEVYDDFLVSVWEEDAKYMNYIEGVKFAQQCASLLSKSGILDRESMAAILKSQTSVMTVRGQVREEFDASMNMTRL